MDLQFVCVDVRSRRLISSCWNRIFPPLHTYPDLRKPGDTGGQPQRFAVTSLVRTMGWFGFVVKEANTLLCGDPGEDFRGMYYSTSLFVLHCVETSRERFHVSTQPGIERKGCLVMNTIVDSDQYICVY